MDRLHDAALRETAGRETILRFRMQFQAAAFAALEILSGNDVDRVYCDYHEDFVVRRSSNIGVNFHFFQVKTKERLNKQWNLLDVFSIKKNGNINKCDFDKIRNSIAGKLYLHAIEFGENCKEATILSNVQFTDEILDAIEDLQAGKSKKKAVGQFISHFKDIFSSDKNLTEDQIRSAQAKLSIQPGVTYIGETLDNFTRAARGAIYDYSEIDLKPQEIDEIARSLVSLVMNKSCTRLSGINKNELDAATSVGLTDLLEVLSISTPVYETLKSGEDLKAIKAASILQRQLKQANATDSMIETASRMKVKWDVWLRNARHVHTELDLEMLIQEVDSVCTRWLLAGGVVTDLRNLLSETAKKEWIAVFPALDVDLLFGGVCAAMVRRGAR